MQAGDAGDRAVMSEIFESPCRVALNEKLLQRDDSPCALVASILRVIAGLADIRRNKLIRRTGHVLLSFRVRGLGDATSFGKAKQNSMA